MSVVKHPKMEAGFLLQTEHFTFCTTISPWLSLTTEITLKKKKKKKLFLSPHIHSILKSFQLFFVFMLGVLKSQDPNKVYKLHVYDS